MLARDFKPGFRIDLHHKDLGIATSAARRAGVALPLGSVAAQLVAAVKAQDGGLLDHASVIGIIEQLSGRVAYSTKG